MPETPQQDIQTALGWPALLLATLGGLLLMVMMSLTVGDVVGRYVFDAPIKGATELTEILLSAVIFLGLGALSMAEDHVTVDLVTDHLPDWIQPWRQAVIGLASAAILIIVSWRIWIYASQIGSYGGTTTNLAIPIAPLGYFCAICAFSGGLVTAALPLKRLFLRN